MGAEKEDDERGASESSGLDDIMSLGAAFGADDDEDGSPNVAGGEAEDDGHDNLSAGYGGVAAASLVGADASDLAGEAANKPSPSSRTSGSHRAVESSAAKKAKPVEPPAPAPSKPRKAAAEAKPAKPAKHASSAPGRSVKTTDADASAAAALVANTAAASQVQRVAPPAARKEEGGSGMTWLIVIGLLALLGGGYWFVFVRGATNDNETARAVAAAEPVEKEEPPVVAKAAPPPEPEPEPVVEEPKLDLPAVEEPVEEEEVETTVRKSKRRNKTDDGKGETKAAEPAPEPEPEPEPEEKAPPPQLTEDQYRTECLLNPNKPGCAEAKRKYGDKYKDLDKTLPDKLSESDVRAGVSPRKSAAKACASKHGAEPGTVVRVKLSIEGDSGKVLSAAAVGPHAGTPLGECVANALKEAKFRRFKSGQLGTTFPVTM